MLAGQPLKNAMPPNFAEKTFANSYKTSKFAKVFNLKSFPLYGIYTLGTAWPNVSIAAEDG